MLRSPFAALAANPDFCQVAAGAAFVDEQLALLLGARRAVMCEGVSVDVIDVAGVAVLEIGNAIIPIPAGKAP